MKFTNKLFTLGLIGLLILCLTACKSKQTPIDHLQDLTEEVKTNYENYTEEDWRAFSQEYELIEQELEEYNGQYSAEEKKEIGKLKGACHAYMTKYSIKNLKNKMEHAINEAQGWAEGFTDAIGE